MRFSESKRLRTPVITTLLSCHNHDHDKCQRVLQRVRSPMEVKRSVNSQQHTVTISLTSIQYKNIPCLKNKFPKSTIKMCKSNLEIHEANTNYMRKNRIVFPVPSNIVSINKHIIKLYYQTLVILALCSSPIFSVYPAQSTTFTHTHTDIIPRTYEHE